MPRAASGIARDIAIVMPKKGTRLALAPGFAGRWQTGLPEQAIDHLKDRTSA